MDGRTALGSELLFQRNDMHFNKFDKSVQLDVWHPGKSIKIEQNGGIGQKKQLKYYSSQKVWNARKLGILVSFFSTAPLGYSQKS